MGKPSLSSYRNVDLCAEIVRRLQNGSELQQYNILSGTLTFYGRPTEKGYRSRMKEGSQRWLHLRNIATDKDLMKELMDRILQGERHAYNEFVWAVKAGRVGYIRRRNSESNY